MMSTRMKALAGLLGLKLLAGLLVTATIMPGCGKVNTGRSDFVPADPSAPLPLDKGVRINVDPAAPAIRGKDDVHVDVTPGRGVNIDIEGRPIRDRIDEYRHETAKPLVTP